MLWIPSKFKNSLSLILFCKVSDVSDVKNDDSEYLKESVEKLTEKIKQLKTTYAWKWGNTPDQEREIMKGMILQSLGLQQMKEKENGYKK